MYNRLNFKDELFHILLEMPALDKQNERDLLLRNLPQNPVLTINRSNTKMTDLNNILNAVDSWGQLDTGELAIVVLINNALLLAKGTQQEQALWKLKANITISTTISSIASTNKNIAPIEEVVIGQDGRLTISFFERGLVASRAVAKVLVHKIIDGKETKTFACGSGWLITPNLLVTNFHVIEARNRRKEQAATESDLRAQAMRTVAHFNYLEENQDYFEYTCTELVNFNEELDYALLRLSEPSSNSNKPLSSWGYLSVSPTVPNLVKGDRLNIIQHPQCGPQRIAIRSNFYVDTLSTPTMSNRIRYLTDTEPGSSGSPVFNDDWQVVALHHAAVQVPETIYKGEVIKYNNQGILIHKILESLPEVISRKIQAAQSQLIS
jgi:V8-like Glu-specific endopeptidase